MINNNYSALEHSKMYNYNLADVGEVRSYLDKFDISVNPFINKNVDIKDFNNVLIDSKKDFYDSSLVIISKEDGNKTSYREGKSFFSFQTEYNNSFNTLIAIHYFSDGKEKFDIIDSGLITKYNLTDNIVIQNNVSHKINDKIILTLCSSLNYATAASSSITIDNMENVKKLILK